MRLVLLPILVIGLLATGMAQTGAPQQFERIKSLDGKWNGRSQDGKPVSTSFLTTSGGHTVLQMLHPTGWPEKPTVYHLDRDRVMLTHYCSAGNQPRMVAAPTGTTEIDFKFLDATSLESAETGHMSRVVFRFKDARHFSQEWAWHENGKDEVDIFYFERAKH
jgi:hypothetical protein